METYPAGDYPNYANGDHVITEFSGSITDGSGPILDYQNNTNATWLIDPQTAEDSVSNITIEFFALDTEANDLITIYDGESPQDYVLAEFSGNELPEAITSTGNKLLIVFNSDNIGTAGGWYAEYSANMAEFCQGLTTLTELNGSFGDGSGSFNYYNNSVCMWQIVPELAEIVTLSFTAFDTESQSDDVKIYDGESQQLLATYSGSYTPENLPDPVTSPSGNMIIVFHSGASVSGAGWEAEYTSFLTDIDKNTGTVDDFIIYPNPASDNINIEIPLTFSGNVDIEMLTLDGKRIYTQKVNLLEQGQSHSVNMNDLPLGVYIIKLTSTEKSSWKRIIKN